MHPIRLRGPWKLEPLARFIPDGDGAYLTSTDELPPPATATMPADWSASFGPAFCGRVRYRRTFQKPTGLDSGERVWLVVEAPRSSGSVRLNDQSLGKVACDKAAGWFDITAQLQEHNRLEIIVDHPPKDVQTVDAAEPGGLVGEVRLEIAAPGAGRDH
jgi:hypothetical protein